MNTHSATSFGGKDVPRLSSQMEELEGLLRRQIELVRKSDYRGYWNVDLLVFISRLRLCG